MRSHWLLCLLAATACGGPPSPAAPGGSGPGSTPAERPLDLTGGELRSYDAYLERFPSPCSNDQSLAVCLEKPGSCPSCAAAARFVARSIRSGYVAQEVEARYLGRFEPSLVQVVDIKDAPTFGPTTATVTIVEFADFQCPFCAATVPVLDALVESYAPHVRVAFRDFPIKYHPHAHSTAQAGVAAHNQGKFWDLHHLMFANREQLDRPDVERYARSLNLDMRRFLEDWDSEKTAARVQASYDQGVSLQVRGTPAFFINGRPFDLDLFDFGGEDLLSWIELEIEMATGKPYKR